jgi:hypothetical protein
VDRLPASSTATTRYVAARAARLVSVYEVLDVGEAVRSCSPASVTRTTR